MLGHLNELIKAIMADKVFTKDVKALVKRVNKERYDY
jgi:flagellar biosynthesis component FlhA